MTCAGFSSTTKDRKVAEFYAKMSKEAQATTVIEAQQGMVDRGADISFLSQFSHESETLFPPLMAVEVLSTRVEGHALMVQAKFALNMMSLTLSEVLGKRRKLIDAMGEQIVDQVGFQLEGTGFEELGVVRLRADILVLRNDDAANTGNNCWRRA